ncbi:L,D-transpeptidase family protein [Granulibacter bethesdensis]|uniref:L,D-transpeptidase family protein n=1 Tax=Granulibacter bethesdensis TaxID=364410 RepID=UPI00090CCD35|nr:L,D-transpeptidase family protein [Granulibacter bethesdensis]APH60338.1 putative cytosolic protein [Granulibacter bethesdensis]
MENNTANYMEAIISPDGRLMYRNTVLRVALGRAGVTTCKQEGDGATPVGILPLRRVFYRADRLTIPVCACPMEPIAPSDGWCDDPAHPQYNCRITRPFSASHEELWRPDDLYDIIGVLGWNDQPVEKGRGSAIFLHVAHQDYQPTAGCLALAAPDVIRLLKDGITSFRVLPA